MLPVVNFFSVMKEQSVSAKLYILNDFHTCLSEIECCKSISQITEDLEEVLCPS